MILVEFESKAYEAPARRVSHLPVPKGPISTAHLAWSVITSASCAAVLFRSILGCAA